MPLEAIGDASGTAAAMRKERALAGRYDCNQSVTTGGYAAR
jgi:hypothetical protein